LLTDQYDVVATLLHGLTAPPAVGADGGLGSGGVVAAAAPPQGGTFLHLVDQQEAVAILRECAARFGCPTALDE
jgi:hypothetical protein